MSNDRMTALDHLVIPLLMMRGAVPFASDFMEDERFKRPFIPLLNELEGLESKEEKLALIQ